MKPASSPPDQAATLERRATVAPSIQPLSAAIARADELGRVKSGLISGTSADILATDAEDPSAPVHAALTMNGAASLRALSLLATDADERVRALLARKLSILLPSITGTERDRFNAQALATLAILVTDEAVRVRAAIAEVVKDMADAPRELILRLARDSSIRVSDPVIRLSPQLTADDLLGLLAMSPSPSAATAVARRPGLQPMVCDAIAALSDGDAIRALLENPSASIRESTLDALIARAAEHEAWHDPLVRRPHLTTRAARALSTIVATELLDVLASRGDLDPGVALELRQRLTARLQPAGPLVPPPEAITLEQAMAEARVLDEENQVTEASILDTAGRGESQLACAMLALAADLPAAVVERAVTLRSAKGIVSLVWKAGFSMRTAIPLQLLLARLAPNTLLRPTCSDGFPLSADEMRWQLDFLARTGK